MNPTKPIQPEADSQTAAPTPAAAPSVNATPPIYGSVHFDSGVRYFTEDPTDPPINDGGVVKLGTSEMPDTNFLNFLQTENAMITGNAAFTTPSPSIAVMAAAATDLSTKLNVVAEYKLLLKEATNAKDLSRHNAENLIKTRATYVQLTSNGNTGLILSAGFPVRNTPSPIGVLPPPLNLRVDLNGTIGKMILNWNAVAKARGYLLECAIVGEEPLVWQLIEVGGKTTLTLNDRVVGVTYIFRVAAVGGSSGRSDWSSTVTRTAA